MTEKESKPVAKTEKPDALETVRLGELSGGVTGGGENKDLGDEEMRNTPGG
jgi:hypothetical protein